MDVVLQWGPDRAIPEADRMRRVHPDLTDEEIQGLRNLAYKVLSETTNVIAPSLKGKWITREEAIDKLQSEWVWLNRDQALQAINQGEYYHWRETGS